MKQVMRLAGVLLALAVSAASAQGISTNQDIIKLIKAGLGDSIVIQAIDSSSSKFDSSAAGLIALKQGGASDAVIQRVMAKSSPAVAKSGAPAARPAEVGMAGEKCREGNGPPGQLEVMDEGESRYVRQQNAKVASDQSLLTTLASHFASTFTLGTVPFTIKAKMEIDGAASPIRLKGNAPSFVALGLLIDQFPEEMFFLVKFDVKDGSRSYPVGEARKSIGSTKTTIAIPPGNTVPLDFTLVQKGCIHTDKMGKSFPINIFGMKPKAPIAAPGEYALVMGGVQTFDFGIDSVP